MTTNLPGNDPERLRWFNELGFGLFIHWSMDSQLGSVIGHSMAHASTDYLHRFIHELPATFNPKKLDANAWAVLAKLAGVRYVVFTTKHHSGFCMFHTRTTGFEVGSTPFRRDITAEVVAAFRAQGIAVGLYFSPDDFQFLHGKGRPVHRGVLPEECDGLLAHNQAQMRELLTNYGKIDLVFFDGPSDGLRELCWEIDPEIVVTRGAMPTPEQHLPGLASLQPWEACVTMGTGWQYKPTNERYKSGTELIDLLIETRAKGGNLLLNVGPKPDGELPIEQEALLREIALWHFVNSEAVHGTRSWHIPREGDVWFTAGADGSTVYAHLRGLGVWPLNERKSFRLASVRAGNDTTVHVLGQADDLTAGDRPAIEWRQQDDALHVDVARMQRLYNNRRWPNPVVLKITGASPGWVPPTVETGAARPIEGEAAWMLSGRLAEMGEGGDGGVSVAFQYRERRLLIDPPDEWHTTSWQPLDAPGEFTTRVTDLVPGTACEFRAVARSRGVDVYGDSVGFSAVVEL